MWSIRYIFSNLNVLRSYWLHLKRVLISRDFYAGLMVGYLFARENGRWWVN